MCFTASEFRSIHFQKEALFLGLWKISGGTGWSGRIHSIWVEVFGIRSLNVTYTALLFLMLTSFSHRVFDEKKNTMVSHFLKLIKAFVVKLPTVAVHSFASALTQ